MLYHLDHESIGAFPDIDAQTLATAFSMRMSSTHQQRTDRFNTVFDFDLYHFFEYMNLYYMK